MPEGSEEGAKEGSLLQRVEQAENAREEGNAAFKSTDLKTARQHYERILTLVRIEGHEDDVDYCARARPCRTSTLLNLALCCLREEPVEAFRALELCEEALDIEPENPKAMYRKAKALIELDELQEAEWELVRACKLVPKDVAIRKDLEQLRSRQRDGKAKEKATFKGLFDKSPGFASDDRPADAMKCRFSERDMEDMKDLYFHDGDGENPYEAAEDPHRLALEFQATGRFGDAVLAWEASLAQSASRKDWADHFTYCLEFGRLFMDVNMDRLALRCFNKVLEPPEAGQAENEDDPASPALVRRYALLLKAICLLNEAEGDPKAEVSACLELWLRAERQASDSEDQPPLQARIEQWREAAGTTAGADSAVALGLLLLLQGPNSAAPHVFAEALKAPEDCTSCFGGPARYAARWNMFGAVLANRELYKGALEAYRQALGRQPSYPRALMNSAIAHSEVGEHRQAVACYAFALGKIPIWSTDSVWPLLKKAVSNLADSEDLAEAAEAKNLTKVRQILGPELTKEVEPFVTFEAPEEVLARIGLPTV